MRGPEDTEILIGEGFPDPLLSPAPGRARAAVLTQPGATRIAADVAYRLRGEDLEVEVIGVPDRDQAKTLAVVESVYESLATAGLGRSDVVVGVGGGSVTDLAGFVAATWLRGVDVAYVPTTLLAAVDASIGGKTGVNLGGKNLVGAFWHPSRVVVDLEILRRLPEPLKREGLVEALKAGLVGDAGLFQVIEDHGSGAPLDEVVKRSISVKMSIVTDDEREAGKRAFLNLGHTVGHAIEFASTLTHGDSVGLGLIAAAAVSKSKTGFAGSARVKSAVGRLGVPTAVDDMSRARVLELIAKDKKRDESGIRMVLLSDIGSPVIAPVSPRDLEIGLSSVGL